MSTGDLPPGQRVARAHEPVHYGRVPRIELGRWRLTVGGATAQGGVTVLDWPAFCSLPRREVRADLHCVARTSVTGLCWEGVPAAALLDLAPPEPGAEHVLLSAANGYAAGVQVADLRSPDALLATHLDGRPLSPEHGWPVRVVLPGLYGFKGPKWLASVDYHHRARQGWWEAHGYHRRARVWAEERYDYQGDGLTGP